MSPSASPPVGSGCRASPTASWDCALSSAVRSRVRTSGALQSPGGSPPSTHSTGSLLGLMALVPQRWIPRSWKGGGCPWPELGRLHHKRGGGPRTQFQRRPLRRAPRCLAEPMREQESPPESLQATGTSPGPTRPTCSRGARTQDSPHHTHRAGTEDVLRPTTRGSRAQSSFPWWSPQMAQKLVPGSGLADSQAPGCVCGRRGRGGAVIPHPTPPPPGSLLHLDLSTPAQLLPLLRPQSSSFADLPESDLPPLCARQQSSCGRWRWRPRGSPGRLLATQPCLQVEGGQCRLALPAPHG